MWRELVEEGRKCSKSKSYHLSESWWCNGVTSTKDTSEAGSHIYSNVLTADKRIQMNSEVFQTTFSAHIQSNAPELTGQCFMRQMDSDEHTVKSTLVFLRKRSVMLHNGQVPRWESRWRCTVFYLLKTKKLKEKCHQNKEELKKAATEAWQNMTRDKTQWWCLWAPDSQLSLTTNDLQTNIKSSNLIYGFIGVSILFAPFKKKEATYTMCCNSYNVQIIWINTIRLKFDVEAHLKNWSTS